jgi:4-hydroxy-tetrahydrodipicolinate synthase
MTTTFQGSMVALVTPFKQDGSIDWDALSKLVDFQLEGGTHGLIICGTTGEAATMTPDEQRRVLAFVVKQVDGRIPVIAGTGSTSTQVAVELSKQAKEVGVDGLLVVTPPYNKPTQAGLIAHFEAVIEATEIPMILYNVPGRTCSHLQPETAAHLCQSPHVVAIKEATGNLNIGAQFVEQCGDKLDLLSGDDFTALPLLSIGGKGWISVTANIMPAKLVAMWDAWQAGEIDKARELHISMMKIHRAMFMESNPIPCKHALHLMGFCEPTVRLPLVEMTPSGQDKLASLLQSEQLLS